MEFINESANKQIRRTKRNVLIIFLIIFIICIGIVGYWIYNLFFSMNYLPTGELITTSYSPNGNYELKLYRVNGGATTSNAIRGEIIYNNSKKKPKNIYWSYREEDSNIEWINDDTVIINGHKLKLPNEVYDWRK